MDLAATEEAEEVADPLMKANKAKEEVVADVLLAEVVLVEAVIEEEVDVEEEIPLIKNKN